MLARQRFERVVLGRKSIDELFEGRLVLRLPPGAQHAERIGFGPLVIEAVAHLVPDNAADASVVHGGVRGRVKERAAAGSPPETRSR